jgi:uncharacterized DUF497 family protein
MKIVWTNRSDWPILQVMGWILQIWTKFFFESSLIVPAKLGRQIAVGRHRGGIILVVFVALGTEGLSVVSMRPASRRERRLIDG